ncbi:unnamed protein product [Adineta steineri]|uniref:Uncharacterized protein n=1 Tax=Adineta steineri TaxID=433720 RepID=A0A815ZFN6_9BILA|nr:unnamed protein product [Adineta steineri]CAF1582190.1 unnamed protein product [Adineta steineri]
MLPAKYYKTISDQSPQLFAVKPDKTIWCHDENEWFRYQIATGIKYSKIDSEGLIPKRGTFSSTNEEDDEPHFGELGECGCWLDSNKILTPIPFLSCFCLLYKK